MCTRTECPHAGDLTKKDVRHLASIAGLPTFKRKDSQGICFLGKVKFNEFVERHLGEFSISFLQSKNDGSDLLGKWPGLILEEGTRHHLG